MLKTLEKKKIYIQATRFKNYQASLKLEGINRAAPQNTLSKSQILEKYKKPTQ